MKPKKEKTARLNGVPSECSFCLVLSLSYFFLSLSLLYVARLGGIKAPQRANGIVRKIRHDCIVMLSACVNAQFGAQICAIHQSLISCSSSWDVFYGGKQSDANMQFVVPQRSVMTEVWWSWRAVARWQLLHSLSLELVQTLSHSLSLCRFRQVHWHLQNLISLLLCAKSSNNRRQHQVIILLSKCFSLASFVLLKLI